MGEYLKKIQRPESGFTLIEIMVVIAIIGTLSMIALPNFIGSRNNSMLKSAARDILGDINKIKMNAIKDNKAWSINFISDGYQIQGPVNVVKTIKFNNNKSGVIYGKGSATIAIGANFGSPDFITYNGNTLTFNSRGTCNSGYIYLTNKQGTVFGIGTLASGITIFKQWMGSNWSN